MMITLISAILALVILFCIFWCYYGNENHVYMWLVIGFSFYGIATILNAILTAIFN